MLTLKYTFKDGTSSVIQVSSDTPLSIVSACGKDVSVEILSHEPGKQTVSMG